MMREIIIDSFAGGGGASTGIEMALGRSPDVAINHSEAALALHAANHPDTIHLDSNIWDVSPSEVCAGRPVGLLWASPDCKHFSKAKGGKPLDRNIRDLAWVVVRWAEEVKPKRIFLENVEEFVTWGPLYEDGSPIAPLRGHTFGTWVGRLKAAGYKVQWRELRGCDFGAPTIRKRLFVIARRDGERIIWPKPTHGNPNSAAVRSGKLKPWRIVAECIDWTRPCPSIFDSKAEIFAKYGLRAIRPSADNTMARIAKGFKHVLDEANPFMVSIAHGDSGGRREYPLDEPYHTASAGGVQHAIVAPFMVSLKGSNRRDGTVEDPHPAICAGGNHSVVVSPSLVSFNGASIGHGADELIAPYLNAYYGSDQDTPANEPMHTATVKPRFGLTEAALSAPPFLPEMEDRAHEVAEFLRAHDCWDGGEFVTIEIGGSSFVVVDIGMRMLTPRELYNAQGFPADYEIERGVDGRIFPKSVQVSCVGNSVCPPVAAAIVAANCQDLVEMREAAE